MGIRTVIEKAFNARTGGGSVGIMEDDWEVMEESRKSRDKKVNKEGRVLLKGKIEEVEWEIFNGNIKRGDGT